MKLLSEKFRLKNSSPILKKFGSRTGHKLTMRDDALVMYKAADGIGGKTADYIRGFPFRMCMIAQGDLLICLTQK